jgi:PBSX family phage terminase large subunit
MDTLQKVLRDHIPKGAYTLNETDHYARFANGSEVWIDGLDDKDRVDKILGREYATIYFNEISQLPYDTVTTVLTRLSQSIPGCRNMAYYDCNPAGRLHWANKIFLHGELPDGKPCGLGYAYLKVNPEDNRGNLPPRYIEDILERLPEMKRKRFLLGEWTDPEGTIFTNWDVAEITDEIMLHSRHTYGLDFGFSVDPAVLTDIYVNGDDVWIDELIYQTQLTNDDLGEMMKALIVDGVTVWADCAEPKSVEELRRKFGYRIEGALKGPDSVRVGIDWLLSKRIHVTGRSANIQMELANYTWKVSREGDMKAEPIDDYNHAIDSIRYGCSEGIGEPNRVLQISDWGAAELGL